MGENIVKNNKFHKDTFDKTTEERRQKVQKAKNVLKYI